jgi:hypothetical protein
MFAFGSYESKAEFVKAYNARHGTEHKAGNFVRDFRQQWEMKLGKSTQEIQAAERRVKERQRGGDGDLQEGSRDF